MQRKIVTFQEVALGQSFEYAGGKWTKVSTRTATISQYNKRFYFGKNETVAIYL